VNIKKKMKKKELQSYLQKIQPFEKPNVKLEQYPTPPNLATDMMFAIENSYEDLSGKMVCDLGCGSGMLTIASSLLGSSFVLAVDIDENAINTAKKNISEIFDENGEIDFLNCNVTNLPSSLYSKFDTVIMNPPFGTKVKGIDIKFLEVASNVNSYSKN
jgi:rRNA N6-adenosine-methyltransferase METTL5